MKQVTSIRYGVIALAIAAGSAIAEPSADAPSDSRIMEDSSQGASTVYDIDEDRDGRTDRQLMLEQSDSLA